jgi:hypothetical protein
MLNGLKRLSLQIALLSWACIYASAGHAEMVTTSNMISPSQFKTDKQVIQNSLARENVKQALLKHGVQPAKVEQRLDQLTPQEMHQLAGNFEKLPAAGFAGVFILSGSVTFMLEMMGVTDLTTTF